MIRYMDAGDAAVLVSRDGNVGVMTLNRAEGRNSMTPELLQGVGDGVRSLRRMDGLRCVVVTGRGRCFSAGADFTSQIQSDADGADRQPHERSFAMYRPFLSLLDLEVPVVGALNGHAVGGGFGLALLCDVRIANREAKYGANFARLGLQAGMGITYLLPRLVGVARANELLFTGRLVTGEEAEAMGLVNGAVDAAEVVERAMELATNIAGNAPYALRQIKASVYRGLQWRVAEAAQWEAFGQATSLNTEDADEGIRALLEKREPHFKGR